MPPIVVIAGAVAAAATAVAGIAQAAGELSHLSQIGRRKPPGRAPAAAVRSDLQDVKVIRNALHKTQAGRCNGCGSRVAVFEMQVDHIKPLARGGTHRFGNLQGLCGRCNRIKGPRDMDYLRRRLEEGR